MIDLLYIVENANLRGGTEILTFNLMHAMRAKGINVLILSVIPYTGGKKNVISLNDNDYKLWSTKETAVWNKLTFCIASDKCLCELLCRKVTELKPRLVVNQTYDIITALPLGIDNIAQVFNWSVVGYEKSVRDIIAKKRIVSRILSCFCNWGLTFRRHKILSKIPKLVILTKAAAKELKSLNLDVLDSQMVVIADPLVYSEDSKVVSSLENHNIIFVGRLSHEKGVMRLLRIWERISAKLPNYTLSIYGEGGAKVEMERFIEEKKISNVHFMGFSSDLASMYTNADMLCMTSDTEGFGMVLIEAMYYGVPCVSFDCLISPKEIIANAGAIVSCYDEKAYADTVVALLKDNARLRMLQQRSIERARDFYFNKITEKWKKLQNKAYDKTIEY